MDAAVTALLTRPPAGADVAYVAAFAGRHRAHLVEIVGARLGDARAGKLDVAAVWRFDRFVELDLRPAAAL